MRQRILLILRKMAEFYCDICNAPMELIKKLATYKAKTSLCRRRKFACTICDYETVIFGDGTKDGFKKIEETELTEEDLMQEPPEIE